MNYLKLLLQELYVRRGFGELLLLLFKYVITRRAFLRDNKYVYLTAKKFYWYESLRANKLWSMSDIIINVVIW